MMNPSLVMLVVSPILSVPLSSAYVAIPGNFPRRPLLANPAAVHTKRDELAAAGLCPGEIQPVDHNNVRGTHFYCTAPRNIVVEIATPPNL